MGRCIYRYKDNEQCIIDHLPPGRTMCTDHALLTRRAEEKAKNDAKRNRPNSLAEGRASRAKPVVEKTEHVERWDEHFLYDHTAPWRCSLQECEKCKDKPTYRDYFKEKYPDGLDHIRRRNSGN